MNLVSVSNGMRNLPLGEVAQQATRAAREMISMTTLTGHIQRLDFTSGITDAAWDLALMLKSSNGKSLVATERYAFKASYGAEAACLNAAQALMPAIQNVVGKAIRDPAFSDLLK